MSTQSRIQQMKTQLKELTKEQQAQIKGGLNYCYGDGVCRAGVSGPVVPGYCPSGSGYC